MAKLDAKNLKGLTSAEVLESRQLHGINVLTPPERDPWWKLYFAKFEDPIIRILLIAAVVALLVGIAHNEYIEAIGIMVAIFLATTMSFVNEYKAGKEFDILNKVNDDVEYKAIRDGRYVSVLKRDIVVGDIILLETGEEVPVDGDILEAISLSVDESSLTGESAAAPKFADGDPAALNSRGKGTAYPWDKVFRGTMVQDGHGIVRVTFVGDSTEIGKTAVEASMDSGEETPLNKQLGGLSKVIGVVGFGVAGLLFVALSVHAVASREIVMSGAQWVFMGILVVSVLIALVRVWLPIGYDFLDVIGFRRERPRWLEAPGFRPWLRSFGYGAAFFLAAYFLARLVGFVPGSFAYGMADGAGVKFLNFFMMAVTVIVVAVPEGLPMSVTLSLAYSMRRMTASNTLVRKMDACETIGAVTVICTDKTGTLTMNKMTVYETDFVDVERNIGVIEEAIAANSTAHLSFKDNGEVEALGNPTESALLLWLNGRGVSYEALRSGFEVLKQLTFSTERKFMATFGRSAKGGLVTYAKGAPEIILGRCGFIASGGSFVPLEEAEKSEILASIRSFQGRGMRALGFAYRDVGQEEAGFEVDDLARSLVWLGFAAISDPVRDDVPDAIRACFDAGIKVKIVTGDNKETAKEIGRQIGLVSEGEDMAGVVLTGDEFEAMSDEELKEALPRLKILSRARPIQKQRLVRLLQELGEIVAVTGDGTNDAPALNRANVGLSMGKNGTAVAKEASDIILLDDSFRSIVNAAMWGRSLYQNIQRFILFQLTVNVTALLIALLGPFIGVELPLTVTQMLWVNLIMDTFAALALASEPPHWEVMKDRPRDPEAFIVTPSMAKGIFGYGIVFVVVLTLILVYIQRSGISPYELTVFFSIFVMLQFWNLFNARTLGLGCSAFSGLHRNMTFVWIAVLILVGQVIMVQVGGQVFRTVPLGALTWVYIILGTSLVLWVGEVVRAVCRRSCRKAEVKA